ncbi:MAG: tetratricopeptide repeat protein [Planctomycetota bacterium]
MPSDREWIGDLERLFDEACALPADRQRELLDRRCEGNPQLRAEIDRLLRFSADDPSLLDRPCSPLLALEALPPSEEAAVLPENGLIGPYRLLRLIGAGGFGEVYLAEQKQPIERTVAIKLVKADLNSAQVVARFEVERQALAMMDHPSIAKVLDAGTAPSGRPYFVMEHIRGVPITAYCDENRLDLNERLKLLVAVCLAVQHAHQKGVIHRDLKPSNVLVTLRDGVATPVVIDFGIAKALDRPLTDRSLHTDMRVFMGTPEYVSPEQAELSELNIDTRSDVYALGVLAYELMTGTTPLDAQQLRSAMLDELRRMIRDVDPDRPSTRLSSCRNSNEVAAARRTDTRTLSRALRRDVDWIVMKCLEKDRTRRYDSASALAQDIERFLRHEPVLAGPPSLGYRLRKFVRRNRLMVSAASLVLAAVTVGATLAVSGFLEARAALDVAEREKNRAVAVQDFFIKRMLETANPNLGGGPETPVIKVLDSAARELENTFKDQPEFEGVIRETLAKAYHQLGRYDDARVQLDRSIEIGATFRRLAIRVQVLNALGKFDEAIALGEATLARAHAELGFVHGDTVLVASALGNVLWRAARNTEAEALLTRVAEAERVRHGDRSYEVGVALGNLALVKRAQDKNEEAVQLYRQTIEIVSAVRSPDHPTVLTQQNNLAVALDELNRGEEAGAIYRDVWERRRRVLGETHPFTLASLSNVARSLRDQGRLQEAEELLRPAVEMRRSLGAEDLHTLQATRELGLILSKRGSLDEAERLFHYVLEGYQRKLGVHPETAVCLSRLGVLAEQREDWSAARTWHQQSFEMFLSCNGPDHGETLRAETRVAMNLRKAGETEKLRRWYEDLVARRRASFERPDVSVAISRRYARVLLNCEIPELRDPVAALAAARRAVEINAGKDATLFELLAFAELRNGDSGAAAAALERAFALRAPDLEKRAVLLAGIPELLSDATDIKLFEERITALIRPNAKK